MRGLILTIYRPADGGDCSNAGISARHSRALVIGPGIPEIFDAGDMPVVRLTRGHAPGTAKLVPVEVEARWTMFGGCYAATSDSRWCDAVRAICGTQFYGAVPLHDRVED